MTEMYITI